MSTGLTTQIEIDPRGVAWVAGANTKVKEIVLDKLAYGWSPEEMHFQHPHLSMAQIHAALAFRVQTPHARLNGWYNPSYEESQRISRAA